ncbi:hypothetical protein CDS [Bradyrhizobium sp.]|uniref:hypothetical protein n=1 Tax=Bradyrhizobium sp. TaxID=376 RepID=UPI0007C1CF23|nr:hypothetical protein [Bradyrhizobium sp.]CUU20836.1 hypothetical protein CDS [Bradyrhizobium sp.]
MAVRSFAHLLRSPEGKGGIFGFAEFVQAFALLVLIFTVSGTREQFRIETAPIRLWVLIYWSSGAIGALTLASDLWFAQRYPLPSLLSSQAYWQSVLGLLFLSLALTWLWFAYVRPPKFGRTNAHRFTGAVYHYVMQGVDRDLSIVADELGRSARSIIAMASAAYDLKHQRHRAEMGEPRAEDYACDLLLMLGNRRFCRHVAGNAPNTAIALFRAVAEKKEYNIPLSQFSVALATEAIMNKDSMLYHEDAGYFSGYFGYARPFTNTIFGDFDFVEALASSGASPLDVDLDVRWKFDGQQLEAYTRAALTTFKAALAKGNYQHSYALQRAFDIIVNGCSDLHKLNEPLSAQEKNDIHERLRAVVQFVNEAIDAMDKAGIPEGKLRRLGESHSWQYEHWHDKIAQLIFEIIGWASWLKTKEFESWTIHYSYVWGRLFNSDQSKTRKIVLFKVRRLLYEEIKGIENAPNFANAAYLGLCLNVFGLRAGNKRGHRHDEYPLRKAVVAFAQRNYLALVARQPRVAEAVLIGTISFDKDKRQLVKTYQPGLELVAATATLNLMEP